MSLPDLSNLSIAELTSVISSAESLIAEKQVAKRSELLDQFKAMAATEGLDFEDLVGKGAGRVRQKAKPKYKNPEDGAETWSGRGKKPRWVIKNLDAGRTLESMAI